MEHVNNIFPLITTMMELKMLTQTHLYAAFEFIRATPIVAPFAIAAFWKIFMY
jgi:hypothetical protein